MNKAHIMGRITRDIEVKYTSAAEPMAVAKFSVAVNRKFKKDGQPEVDFINCVAFGKLAENISKFFSKGKMIQITGRIQTGSYENKDGVKVYTTDLLAEEFNFTGESKDGAVKKTDISGIFYPIDENIEDDNLPF